MSVTPAQWQTDLFAIVPHPIETSVLLLPGDDGWNLPAIRLEQRLWTPEVEQVNRAMLEHFDLRCVVLRCGDTQIDREAKHLRVVYVLEQRDHEWTPPAGSRWLGREALADLPLAQPSLYSALLDYFDDRDAALRLPWACPGWFDRAERWMRQQLAAHGYELLEPIQQIKSWGISCILRGRTTAGDLYFKVASRRPLFGDEPALMAALAAEHPGAIPAPIAIDAEQGWMLLADVGPELRQSPDLASWKTALRLHSEIQQSFASRPERVLEIGGLDRRLDRLAAQIDALLDKVESFARITEEDVRQAALLRPRIPQMCRELARYAVPETLVHGDLHGGNIALRDDRYQFFDWTDSCLAHPFFDLVTMLEDAEQTLGMESTTELLDTYLEQWTGYASPAELRAAWTLAEPLGSLHQAVSYDAIDESLEPAAKPAHAGGVAYWISRALKAVLL